MEGIDVKEIRQSLGLTQEQLARELGVSFATVSNWERRRSRPSPLAAYRLELIKSQAPEISGEVVTSEPNPSIINWAVDELAKLSEKYPDHDYGGIRIDEELPDGRVRCSFWLSKKPRE
ncbi:helix-turn-helix domain-containing protein [Chloroflexota bacterium]